MLTLKELRNIVGEPKKGEKIPTAKCLRDSDIPIAVKEILGLDTEITVYQNGYVLYQVRNLATVFPINGCKGYSYETDKKPIGIDAAFFEGERWYIRLILEGEDRLTYNLDSREERKQVSYSAVAEDWNVMADRAMSLAEQFIQQEMVEELLQVLTERQRTVVMEYFFEEKTHQQIANELGVSRAAVTDSMAKAIHRMKRFIEKNRG